MLEEGAGGGVVRAVMGLVENVEVTKFLDCFQFVFFFGLNWEGRLAGVCKAKFDRWLNFLIHLNTL